MFVFGNLDYLFFKKNGSCKPKYWTDVTHTFVTQEWRLFAMNMDELYRMMSEYPCYTFYLALSDIRH